MFTFLLYVVAVCFLLWFANFISYRLLKRRVLQSRRWDLNLCCGTTDGGGVNVDIVEHAELPNFVKVDDVTRLPFSTGQFESVLCSHTIEHVPDPAALDAELRRVGKEVIYVLPPLWDLAAVCNFREHRWVFLTLRKKHHTLPPYVALPFSQALHQKVGQRVAA